MISCICELRTVLGENKVDCFIYLFVYVTVECEKQSSIDRYNFNTYSFNKLILALQFPKI